MPFFFSLHLISWAWSGWGLTMYFMHYYRLISYCLANLNFIITIITSIIVGWCALLLPIIFHYSYSYSFLFFSLYLFACCIWCMGFLYSELKTVIIFIIILLLSLNFGLKSNLFLYSAFGPTSIPYSELFSSLPIL